MLSIIAAPMRRLLVALVIFAACAKPAAPAKPLSEPGEKLYAMKGKIVSRNARENSLYIAHEAIPGFMEAMSMDYDVRGAKVEALPANEAKIEARLHVTDDGYWVTDVKPAR